MPPIATVATAGTVRVGAGEMLKLHGIIMDILSEAIMLN